VKHEPPILVTGCAGFIGFHVCDRLLRDGRRVVGFDNVNSYYSPQLKRDGLARLAASPAFDFRELDLVDSRGVADIVSSNGTQCVNHLAAQAGVRWSIENPKAYVDSNIVGFLSILEACRHHRRR